MEYKIKQYKAMVETGYGDSVIKGEVGPKTVATSVPYLPSYVHENVADIHLHLTVKFNGIKDQAYGSSFWTWIVDTEDLSFADIVISLSSFYFSVDALHKWGKKKISASGAGHTESQFPEGWYNKANILRMTLNDEYLEIATEDHPTASYRPYLVVDYKVEIPVNKNLRPSNTTVNPRNPITLSWDHSASTGNQKSFTLNYRVGNGDWTTVTEQTSRNSYTIPANGLPANSVITWNVQTTNTVLEHPSNVKMASFTTVETEQKPPTLLSPRNEYLDVGQEIVLEWMFNGNEGERQASAIIEVSGGGVNESYTVSTGESRLVLDPFTFNVGGSVAWRVRTYNQYGEASPWSNQEYFHLIGKPTTPVIISVTNRAKPTVRWTSDSQQVYELEILKDGWVIYSSGRIPSVSVFEHYVEERLANGNYTARVRVKNRYDLWSEYGVRNFTIEREAVPTPKISVRNDRYKVVIKATDLSKKSYVYRDEALLGEMLDGLYEDYTGANNKKYNYFVRTINEDDDFTDSIKATGMCSFKGNTLSLVRSPEEFILLRFNLSNKPGKKTNIGNDGAFINFDGREYPAYEFSNSNTLAKDLSFSIKEQQLEGLKGLMRGKGPVMFRDHFGEVIVGVIESIDATRIPGGYTVEFRINKVLKEV